jgi:DNA-binding NarL/FixJ family response regulator
MPPIHAFLVEDSPVIRDSLIAILEEVAPVKVIGHAEDERQACRSLAEDAGGCELVIVDLFLREGSGFNVLRSLRERQHRARRVVLTNFATPEVRETCRRLGANRVFDKSAQIEDLVDYCHAIAAGAP